MTEQFTEERRAAPDEAETSVSEEAKSGYPGTASGNASGAKKGDERDQLGTKVVKRKLKTNDVWYAIKIIGKVSSDARKQILASDGDPGQIDVMSLMLTEGVDKAREEINAWFSDLTGIPADEIDGDDIGFYMDVLEDLDVVGIDDFLGRLIPWYRKKFGSGPRDSGSG